MVNLTIDGKTLAVADSATILEAAKAAGIAIPTLCYLKDLNEVGACRVCLVEVEGCSRLVASCNTLCEEGMVVHTKTKRVRDARRANLELILSQHHTECPSCVRSGSCKLQETAKEMNLIAPAPETAPRAMQWDKNEYLVRDDSKCIQCFRCVNVCDKVQGLGVWDLLGTGKQTRIGLRDDIAADFRTACALCGQCATHCPTGALTVRDDTERALAAIEDPDTITVVQIAPAVRTAYGEPLGLTKEEATEGRMVAAVRALGADYVFDTDFSADLTIMEEGSELLEHLKTRTDDLPMFTSCCPGWVRFMKQRYPQLAHRLSSAKSPQQMFGAVTKTYFADVIGVDPQKICCISIMPCSAKKYECDVAEVNDAAGHNEAGEAYADVDIVLTTRELTRLLRNVDVAALPEEEFDSPLGCGSGAAKIFGATGGVMEAALRSVYYLVEGENPDPAAFCKVRAEESEERPWREAAYTVGGSTVKVAVAGGLGNAGKLMDAIEKGEVQYDFVEIMACPGGCSGGGGQPIRDGEELAAPRGRILYDLDEAAPLRFSHENPEVQKLYADYLGTPLSDLSHHLLHTDQPKWKL